MQSAGNRLIAFLVGPQAQSRHRVYGFRRTSCPCRHLRGDDRSPFPRRNHCAGWPLTSVHGRSPDGLLSPETQGAGTAGRLRCLAEIITRVNSIAQRARMAMRYFSISSMATTGLATIAGSNVATMPGRGARRCWPWSRWRMTTFPPMASFSTSQCAFATPLRWPSRCGWISRPRPVLGSATQLWSGATISAARRGRGRRCIRHPAEDCRSSRRCCPRWRQVVARRRSARPIGTWWRRSAVAI